MFSGGFNSDENVENQSVPHGLPQLSAASLSSSNELIGVTDDDTRDASTRRFFGRTGKKGSSFAHKSPQKLSQLKPEENEFASTASVSVFSCVNVGDPMVLLYYTLFNNINIINTPINTMILL
jgi:hypothetical protein